MGLCQFPFLEQDFRLLLFWHEALNQNVFTGLIDYVGKRLDDLFCCSKHVKAGLGIIDASLSQ